MQRVDSDALSVVGDALGLAGTGQPVTELTDGMLEQVVDVGPLIRRGRTPSRSQGIFTGLIEHDHPGVGSLATTITPYQLAQTGLIPPFPSPIPRFFDLWLLSAHLLRTGGAATVTAAVFIDYADAQQAFGVDNAAAAVVGPNLGPLAFWDTLVTQNITFGQDSVTGNLTWPLGIRLSRQNDTALIASSTASAAGVFHFHFVLGLFATGLGQDAVV